MSAKILVVISNKHPSANAKVSGVYRYARICHWRVQVVSAPAKSSDIRALLELWKPDGCIYESGLTGQVPDIAGFKGCKTVFLDADRRLLPKGTALVIHDSEADGRLAARELLSMGRTSFAFVGAPGNVFWSRDREAAYIRTLRLNGFRECRSLHPQSTWRDELKRSREIAAFVKSLPDGCGVFAANDATADKILSVCNLTRRKIPEDIAVIGVDDNESICTHTSPPLSSIAPDFEKGGFLAAEMLNGLLHGKRSFDCRTFGPISVVRRSSTALPSAYNGLALRITGLIRATEGRISPAEIFSTLDCSRRTAESHFRRAIGKSVLEAIGDARFEYACLLLSQRQLAVSAIAQRVGYGSTIAFDRFFKSRTGRTPNAWRGARE